MLGRLDCSKITTIQSKRIDNIGGLIMSSIILAPYGYLGEGGDYPIEVNFAIRIYDSKK